jgi:hypothetical protein
MDIFSYIYGLIKLPIFSVTNYDTMVLWHFSDLHPLSPHSLSNRYAGLFPESGHELQGFTGSFIRDN